MHIDTTQLKKKLEEEQTLLLTELKSENALKNPETGTWDARPEMGDPEADENDRADRAEGYEEKTALVGALQTRLKDIEDALIKMKKGKYGNCEVCGEPIEAERLDANPAARTCMKHLG